MVLNSASCEQQDIINEIIEGNNVISMSVAGSGKSTTILQLAKQCVDKNILQVTYNSSLKHEIRKKVEENEIDNLDIHTYHSLGKRNYDIQCHTDDKIRRILSMDKKLIRDGKRYDIIVQDETQDCTMIYYKLLRKYMVDSGSERACVLILGDIHQSVYEFKNSDNRFLSLGRELWMNMNNRYTYNMTLRESFRVTKPIASFINNVMLGSQRIVSNKDGPVVEYIRHNIWTVHNKITKGILNMIANKGITPNDIFILAGSVKNSGGPLRKLENMLVSSGIPCFVPISDDSKIDDKVIDGKVLFTTFHQSKGRERKVVIIYGFDSSYFKYYCKNEDPKVCPSTLYVGVTRSSERLILVENDRDNSLPFLKKTNNDVSKEAYVHFHGNPRMDDYKENKEKMDQAKVDNRYSVVMAKELVRFLKDEALEQLQKYMNKMIVREKQKGDKGVIIEIPSKVETRSGKYENVSEINEIVIPSIWESTITDDEPTIKRELTCMLYTHGKKDEFIRNAINDVIRMPLKYDMKKDTCVSVKKFLYMGSVYMCAHERLYHKLVQIDKFDWLTEKKIKKCLTRLNRNIVGIDSINRVKDDKINNKIKFSKDILEHRYSSEYGEIVIRCKMNVETSKDVWILKCVDELSMEHLLQLVICEWVCRHLKSSNIKKRKKFKMLNIKNGEAVVLKPNDHYSDEIIDILLNNKYYRGNKDSDSEFLEECERIKGCDKSELKEKKEKLEEEVGSNSIFEFILDEDED